MLLPGSDGYSVMPARNHIKTVTRFQGHAFYIGKQGAGHEQNPDFVNLCKKVALPYGKPTGCLQLETAPDRAMI